MRRSTHHRHGPTLLVTVVSLVALAATAAIAVLATRGGTPPVAPRPVADRALVAPRPEVRASQLLGRWDTSRADAWAGSDRDALGALYVAGSAAGQQDDEMLAAWTSRGLRVQGLRTQVVRLRVLSHRPGRYELEVVDRVVAGTALGPGITRPLPRDGPSARRVVLVEQGERWLVARVSGADPAAPPAEVSAGPSSALR